MGDIPSALLSLTLPGMGIRDEVLAHPESFQHLGWFCLLCRGMQGAEPLGNLSS